MALSPWPSSTATVALAAARTQLKAALESGDVVLSESTLDRVGGAAAARVEGYASGAPQVVKDEAVIRLAGRMIGGMDSLFGSYLDHKIGEASVQFSPPSPNVFVSSGAAGLLSPWRVRRAGAIRETTA